MAVEQNSEILAKDIRDKLRVNYLNNNYQTTTKNGITLTNNGDGTYTLNGITTTDSYFRIGVAKLKGRYKLVGTPLNRGNSSLYEAVDYRVDLGDGVILEENGDREISIHIAVYEGVYNNVVYKPMITDDLDATYDDFTPYNYSLTYNSNIEYFTIESVATARYIQIGKLVIADFASVITGDVFTGLPNPHQFLAVTLRDNTDGNFSTFYMDGDAVLKVYKADNYVSGHTYSGIIVYLTD